MLVLSKSTSITVVTVVLLDLPSVMYIDHFPFAARPLNLETPKATEEVEAPLKKVPLPSTARMRQLPLTER